MLRRRAAFLYGAFFSQLKRDRACTHPMAMKRLLEQRIDSLPDDDRIVFVLRALEELTVEETAAALGIPEAAVRTRFFRARGVVRDRTLGEAFAFDGERCERIVARVLERIAAGTQ